MRPWAQGKSTGKVKSGKGVKGHGKGVEGFDDFGPVALPRIGKAPKGAQGGDAADGADVADGADAAAGHNPKKTLAAPTRTSLWPSCAPVTPPVPAPQPHTPPEALARTLTVSAPEPRTTSVPSPEPTTPPEALDRRPQFELPRAKNAPSAPAPRPSAKREMTSSSSSSSDSESEKEEEAKPAPAPAPVDVPTPTFMALHRRPNADAFADPGALPVADTKRRKKNDFKDEVNNEDQTPRIADLGADGADPAQMALIHQSLPAPSQRPAPRPPRVPEDAPEFNDATLIETLETEVKQNKK